MRGALLTKSSSKDFIQLAMCSRGKSITSTGVFPTNPVMSGTLKKAKQTGKR